MLAYERCLGWAPVTRQALLSPPAQCTPMFLGPKIAPSSFSPSLLSPPIGVPNACILPFREVVWQWQLLSWHFSISYPWRVNRGVFGMQEGVVVCQVGRQGSTKHFCPRPEATRGKLLTASQTVKILQTPPVNKRHLPVQCPPRCF